MTGKRKIHMPAVKSFIQLYLCRSQVDAKGYKARHKVSISRLLLPFTVDGSGPEEDAR